jgi:hypothetical protein
MVRRTNRKNNKKYSKKIKKYSKNNFSKRRRKYSSFKNKRNKRNKKYQKGGDFNSDFLGNYESNLEKIQMAIQQYSGTHSMDDVMKNRFIDEQLTSTRRNAARDLIDNTVYITLEEVASIVDELIIKTYNEHNLNDSENIYLYTSTPNKSFYFISVLALYYIRLHEYKEPTNFISSITPDVLSEVGSNPILIFDDVSYSGSQMADMLNKIYREEVVKKKHDPPNIIVSLIGLNTISKRKIQTVYNHSNYKINPTKSPFELVYLPERLYDPLLLKLGIERYFIINLFFSQMSGGYPLVSIYLDHKIADEVSTYKKTLLYGPIVPKNYDYLYRLNYNKNNIHIKNYFETYITFKNNIFENDFIENDFIDLLNRFNSENPDNQFEYIVNKNYNSNNVRSIMYQILCYVLDKVIIKERKELQSVQSDNETLGNKIKFRPFINSCKDNQQLLVNINDEDIQNMNYLFFNLPSDCILELGKTCSYGSFKILMYGLKMYSEHEEDIENLEKEIEKLQSGERHMMTPINSSDDENKKLIEQYEKDIIEYKDKITKQFTNYQNVLLERNNINSNLEKLELVDCPYTWYKKGDYQMI